LKWSAPMKIEKIELEYVQTGSRVRLTKRINVIGSDLAADVRLEAPGIRPFHCAVGMRGEGILAVWDLGIESQTRINGQGCMNALVTQGDLVTVGGMCFRVHVQGADTARASLAG
jgi:hypothetical protein